jgi:uncharacterized membrane protein YfcA
MAADLLVVLLGIAAGGIAGLFGVGGGVVFVPALALVVGMSELHAQATSLLAIVPVAIFGTWRERRTGQVHWPDVALIGSASIVTAIIGALLADVAPERVLRIGFALVLVWTAVRIVRGVRHDAARPAASDASGSS